MSLASLFSASFSRPSEFGMIPSGERRKNQYVLSRCKEGDMLEFTREGGFAHWAVYVGNGRVIHRPGNTEVREDSFWDVVGDSIARINNYLDGEKSVFPGEEIVARARSQLGTGGYDLVSKNCEHFVTWCRYGVERSQQVRKVAGAAVAVTGLMLFS